MVAQSNCNGVSAASPCRGIGKGCRTKAGASLEASLGSGRMRLNQVLDPRVEFVAN